jgi:hypothetical protein
MRKLVIALCLAACGPDSGSGSIAIGDLGDAVVGSFCDIYVRCGVVADRASCLELFGREVDVNANIIAAQEGYYGSVKTFQGIETCSGLQTDSSASTPQDVGRGTDEAI